MAKKYEQTGDIRYFLPTTTVLVNGQEESGVVRINESDYDPALHTKCDADGNVLDADEDGDGTVSPEEAKKAAAKTEKVKAAKSKKEKIPVRE
jgi:hypothetical protein